MEQIENKLFTNKMLLNLGIPLIIEQILAVTIGMADTVMVATVGEAAVSGISLVDSINFLLIQVFSALATGGAVIVSQYIGRKELNKAATSAKQLIYSIFILSFAISMISLIFNKALLKLLFGAIELDVFNNATIYFYITAASFPFLGVYNAGAAIFRSMRNSKVTMYISLLMNIINVGGNAILIFIFKWGAAGAAFATLVSRIVASIIIIYLLRNKNNMLSIKDLFKFELKPTIIKNILRIGIPTGVENGIFQIGKILVMGLVASFGTSSIAANAISNNVASISTIPCAAVGLVIITVVGQCIGAKDYKQAVYYTKKLMKYAYIMMGVLNLIIFIFAKELVHVFNLSDEATNMAYELIIFYSITSSIFWPMAFTFPNALRAAGDTRFTMIASVSSMWTFRIGFSYVLCNLFGLGLLGVWIAMAIDWIVRDIVFITRFIRGKWKKIKVI